MLACSTTHRIVDTSTKEKIMLYTVAIVLIVLWLLGLVSSYTMGGFILGEITAYEFQHPRVDLKALVMVDGMRGTKNYLGETGGFSLELPEKETLPPVLEAFFGSFRSTLFPSILHTRRICF